MFGELASEPRRGPFGTKPCLPAGRREAVARPNERERVRAEAESLPRHDLGFEFT